MSEIKFGTDGWRAIIAKEYTVDNVARVTSAVAEWLLKNFEKPSVVIGHDCRFGGAMFTETAARILTHKGIIVYAPKSGFVSTPMVSYACTELNTSIGIVITASHNPPSYNGYKLKGGFGGPLSPEEVDEIEQIIPPENEMKLDLISINKAESAGLIKYVDLEQMYYDKIKSSFDLDLIANSNMGWAYDAMYGAGQNIMKRLLPEIEFLHCDDDPSFKGQAPEPIAKNLQEFSKLMSGSDKLNCGLATDGDADRIGLYNSKGEFVDSHHIILLTIHYLVKYKGMSGKVVTGFSSTPRIKQMCDHYGLEHEEVKIGFKYIASKMADPEQDVLLGGEESGGIALKTFIPERDGIWMGLTIWEFMAKTGKSLEDLINEVYEIVGPFAFERSDLQITDKSKKAIISKCSAGEFHMFGKYQVKSTSTLDGFKYHFDDDRWLMIRPSGTEPVLRTYAEAPTLSEVRTILEACKLTIGA